jgi:NAD(P)-dependent dehydrogenase (short-subunit alcohol dehydrogenase family)
MTPAPTGRPLALVTGASRGLGATVAGFLAAEGYDLVVTARGATDLAASADRLRAHGGSVVAIPGDVADATHRARLKETVARAGRLNLLVNNASELGPSPLPRLEDYPGSSLERVFAVNVLAPLALAQELLPFLEPARGMIVNISSDAAIAGYPNWGGYGASKAALDLLTLTLAHELEKRGVAAIAVDPGDLRTAMHQSAYPGVDISDRPLPEVTLPFWAWVLHQDPTVVSGHRFRAQADRWEVST